jgi:hypothetical protein
VRSSRTTFFGSGGGVFHHRLPAQKRQTNAR